MAAAIGITDCHVHVNRFDRMRPEAQALIRQNPTFSLMERFMHDAGAFLEHLDREGIEQAWLINYCAKKVMGYGPEVNEWIAHYVEIDKKRLVAVGGLEVGAGPVPATAVDALRAAGIRAIKVHTVHQCIRPDDARLWPALSRAAELRMPVIFHTGTSRFPGADNAFADPGPAAAIARAFPSLPIILAHGGRPDHTAEAVRLLRAFPNVWIDLSSCPPHRLAHYFGDLATLSHRLLWGSDWPGPGVPGMRANVEAFRALDIPAVAQRRILQDNADSLLASAR